MMNETPSPAPKSDETNSQIPSFIPEPDDPVDIQAIAGDILQQRCVLLIGPGMLHIDGMPVSEALQQHLVAKHARLLQGVYTREGLYKFRDETAKKRAQTDAIPQFFREARPDEAALSKLLAIPFHLILQVTPDTFLSDRALAHSVNHEFRYFCGGGKPVEPVEPPTAAAPLFYNLCGTADRFDSMVLDYDDVYEYLKSVFSQPGLPQNLRTALDEANTFLFLGFQLEKWYTQLLIRWVSDVKGAERYADRFEAGEHDPDLKGFVRRHLNIVTASQRCFDLVDELYRAFPENQLRTLAEPVTPNTVTMRRYVLNGELEKALLTFDKIAGSIGEKDTATMLISQFNELKRGLNTYALTGEAERLAARRLCEEGLAQEGDPPVCLNLHEAQIGRFYGIEPALLETLVANRLLRAEPDAGGGYTYELPHDTLLEPVLELKRERLEQQRKEELAAEEARIARKKAEAQRRQRRAMLTSVIAGVLVLGAAISIWIAYLQSKKAADAVGLAERKTRDAEISDSLAGIEKGNAEAATRTALAAPKEADQKTKEAAVAQEAARIAEANPQTAIKQSGIDSEKARLAAIEAEQKKKEANEATLLANQAKAEAERLTQVVVTNLLAQSRDAILHLDYDAAFSLLANAASLGTVRDSVAYELMEIAFFRFHAGQSAQAIEPFEMAAKLLDKPGISQKNDIGDAFNALDKDRDSLLNARYFPVMVEMKGGAYQMQGKYETAVPNFRMAETETTVWQYNLFCWANGHDITQRIGRDGKTLGEAKYQPSWGWIGNNPAVYVNWYDAAEYANWLSRKMNGTPAYDIRPEEKDPLNTSGFDKFKWTVTPRENVRGYRLPTEAEWEYAAKGGARHDTFKYSGSDEIDEVAWYGSNSESRTQAVRAKKANGAGLYDMSGNVWEWCFDWYGALPAETPWGAKSGSYRVVRGGGWRNDAVYCLPTNRNEPYPYSRHDYYGFRLVLVP